MRVMLNTIIVVLTLIILFFGGCLGLASLGRQ